MPIYLLHGFRWPRNLIRIHIIVQDLEDAAAEWLMAPATALSMRDNFEQKYGHAMQHLPDLRFIEQFNINIANEGESVQPYAYVAHVVEEIKLGIEVNEVMGRTVPIEQRDSIAELRDQLAPGERVGWFVVWCQDTERHSILTSGPHETNAHASAVNDDDRIDLQPAADNSKTAITNAKKWISGFRRRKRKRS